MRTRSVILMIVVVAGAAVLAWRLASQPAAGQAPSAEQIRTLPTAEHIGETLRQSSEAIGALLAGSNNAVPLSADEKRRRLQSLLDQVGAIDRLQPRDTFDLDLAVEQAGRDPARIHRWVREQTTWVPYRGSLRGARGTLMDRTGNSLDRALLLASLLRASGVSVRLARAQLTSDQVAAFRQQSSVARASRADFTELTEAAMAAIDAHAKRTNADSRQLRQQIHEAMERSRGAVEEMRQRVAAQTAMLVQGLGMTPPDPLAQPDAGDDIEALRDHWWAQWQNGSEWTDLDPALAEAGHAAAPAQETVAPDSLDPDLHHSVQVRVVVEKWDGSRFVEQRATHVDVRPSEVWEEPLRLQHIPMNWPKDLDGSSDIQRRFKQAAISQSEWLPVFTISGRRTTGASILDTGDLNDQPGTRRNPAEGILDAFSGGDTASAGVLTAEWLEYEIRLPGRPARVIRREVFDLVGGAARAAGRGPAALTEQLRLSRALSLLGETEILPLSSQLSSAFVVHLTASQLLRHRAILEGAVHDGQKNAGAGLPGQLFALAVARGEWGRTPGAVYLREPNVLSRHVLFHETNGSVGMTTAIDIVANEVGVHATTSPFMARLEQGVLDANLEATLVGPAAAAGSVADLFGLSHTAGRWVPVRTPQDLAGVEQDADVRARIEQDLRAGFVVFVRRDPGPSRAEVGWWRVNPRTGDTLSFGNRGWGQAMVEYKVAGAAVGIAGVCLIGASLDGRVTITERTVCGLLGAGVLIGGAGAAGVVIIGAKNTGSLLLAGTFGAMLALIG